MASKMKDKLYSSERPAFSVNIHAHLVGSANGITWTARTKSPNLFVEVKVDGIVVQSTTNTTVIERKKLPAWNQCMSRRALCIT